MQDACWADLETADSMLPEQAPHLQDSVFAKLFAIQMRAAQVSIVFAAFVGTCRLDAPLCPTGILRWQAALLTVPWVYRRVQIDVLPAL